MRRMGLGIAGVVGAVVLWNILATALMRETPLPQPIEVFGAFLNLLQDGIFWSSFVVTLTMAVKGFVLAVLVGVILGILIGWFPLIGDATSFVVDFLKPIPPIVIMPLAVLFFGPTQEMGEFLVFYGCVLPIIYQTSAGVRETDPVAVQTSRSYGVGVPEMLTRVVLPSAAPFVATALRTAIPISLIVSVVAGLLGGGPGLGQSVERALSSSSIPEMYALVGVLGLLGLILLTTSSRLESKMLHWHPSHRKLVS